MSRQPTFAAVLALALALSSPALVACKGKPAATTVAAAPAPARPAGDAPAAADRVGTATLTPTGPDGGAPSFGPIRFEFDSTTLGDEARRELARLAGWLEGNRARVTIEGHADERGTTEYNVALGQRRAEVIAEYLARLGVAPGRLTTISYGEEHPLAEGDGESAWAQNRRGELRPDP